MVAASKPSDEQVTEAWVYLLGRYLVIRQEAIDLAEDGADYNVLKHNPAVVVGSGAASAPTFVNPNLDVVYSEAWIAVDETTPAILEIPAIPAGRYYTAQIVDEWAEITHNINERNFPDHPNGRYAICLAGSTPEIPDGCLRVDIPSAKAKLLTRVQIGDDVDAAVALQHEFRLASTGQPQVITAGRDPRLRQRPPADGVGLRRAVRLRRPRPGRRLRHGRRAAAGHPAYRRLPGARTPSGPPNSTPPSARPPSPPSCTSWSTSATSPTAGPRPPHTPSSVTTTGSEPPRTSAASGGTRQRKPSTSCSTSTPTANRPPETRPT